MEISYFEINLFFLKLFLLLQLCPKNVITVEVAEADKVIDLNKRKETENGRLTQIETKSKKHEDEIEVLKTLLDEEREFSKQLSGRVSQLEASTSSSSRKSEEFLGRPKRLFRLLPPNIPLNQEIKVSNDNENARFYGPPSSCEDLGKLGYTLNGYYLVHNEHMEVGSVTETAIEVILCRFQLPSEKNVKMEERVGTIQIINKTPATFQSSKVQSTAELYPPGPFTWKSSRTSAGQYVYAENCDFNGFDIHSDFHTTSFEICRDRCSSTVKCTHITYWKGGHCYLKRAPNSENPLSIRAIQAAGNICGYFSANKTKTKII